jgi:hypothetical protein
MRLGLRSVLKLRSLTLAATPIPTPTPTLLRAIRQLSTITMSKVAVCQILSTNDPAHNFAISSRVVRDATAAGAVVRLSHYPIATMLTMTTGMLPPRSCRLYRDLGEGMPGPLVPTVVAPIHSRLTGACARAGRNHIGWRA